MSRHELAAGYRLYAAYCAEVAREPVDPGRRAALLNMAQAWARLAEQLEAQAAAEASSAAAEQTGSDQTI